MRLRLGFQACAPARDPRWGRSLGQKQDRLPGCWEAGRPSPLHHLDPCKPFLVKIYAHKFTLS